MTQHIDPCDTARNNVLAAALALQQCTKTAANIVVIPGTGRFIAIGTRAAVARLLKLDTAAATTQASTAQAKPTDISRRLREYADNNGYSHNDYADTMRAAAEEIERYYGGMMAWKQTAEKKDRDWNEARMARENDRCAARADAQAAAEVRDAALKEAITECDLVLLGVDTPEESVGALNCRNAIRALRASDTGEQADGGEHG